MGPDVEVRGVSIDSRSVEPGQLFVPVVAALNGHDFIAIARDGGAVASLTARELEAGLTSIVVDDTVAALSRLVPPDATCCPTRWWASPGRWARPPPRISPPAAPASATW